MPAGSLLARIVDTAFDQFFFFLLNSNEYKFLFRAHTRAHAFFKRDARFVRMGNWALRLR